MWIEIDAMRCVFVFVFVCMYGGMVGMVDMVDMVVYFPRIKNGIQDVNLTVSTILCVKLYKLPDPNTVSTHLSDRNEVSTSYILF
jgi:hypothetical protein